MTDDEREIEARLDLVVAQIAEGAKPLGLGTVGNEMKDRYRGDFELSMGAWEMSKETILPLAKAVGALAAILTRAKAAAARQPVPTTLDSVCADWAGYVVSQAACPPPKDPQLLGRHCQNYQMPNTGAQE